MGYEFIEYNPRQDKIGEIILNRPEKLNAMTDAMRFELVDALERAETDDNINIVIIKGNGRSFCSGHDLSKVGTYYGFTTDKDAAKKRRPSQRSRLVRDKKALAGIHERILFSGVPTIAAVHGHCLGGGCMLQLLCDFTVATHDAVLGYPEQEMGFSGTLWNMGLLIHTIGTKRAQRLGMLGETITGKEAAEMGLVTKSVPPEELDSAVEAIAQRVARYPRDGIAISRANKELIYKQLGLAEDYTASYIMHTLFTNVRWEDDEYNFFKVRRDAGTDKAIKSRTDFYEG